MSNRLDEQATFRLDGFLRLRERDPGLLRLTQALKTVLAVLISLAIFYGSPTEKRLFAAISTAFLMQCTSTGGRRRQQLTLLVSGLSMMLVAGLGAALYRFPWAQHLLLVALALAVFYVIRFLPDQNQFPIFGFILCLLAIHLGGGSAGARADVMAVAVALPVAFATYFAIRPPDRLAAFIEATRLFCLETAAALDVLRRLQIRPGDSNPLGPIQGRMQRLINFGQQVLDQWPEQALRPNQINHHKATDRRDNLMLITDVLLRQYESLQAVEMLEQSMLELAKTSDPVPVGLNCGNLIPPELKERLNELLRHLSAGFQTLAADCRDFAKASGPPASDIGEILLQQSQLQTSALAARHPICPEMTHLFTAVVACRELSHIEHLLGEHLQDLRAAEREKKEALA